MKLTVDQWARLFGKGVIAVRIESAKPVLESKVEVVKGVISGVKDSLVYINDQSYDVGELELLRKG